MLHPVDNIAVSFNETPKRPFLLATCVDGRREPQASPVN